MFFLEDVDGEELYATADTIDELLEEAMTHGLPGDWIIQWGPGDVALEKYELRRRIAYRASRDPQNAFVRNEQILILRILEPAYFDASWQPGMPAHRYTRRGRPVKLVPMLAPQVMQWPFPMARTSVRGCEYPAPIERYVDGFRDTSWKNDVTDSIAFAIGGVGYIVFINPTNLLDWTDQTEWYAMYLLLAEDDGRKLDIDQMLDEHAIDYDADSVLETNDPAELLRVIAELAQAVDPSLARAHALDLKPSRESARARAAALSTHDDMVERFKLIRQELQDEDPRLNPRKKRTSPRTAALLREREQLFSAMGYAGATPEQVERYHQRLAEIEQLLRAQPNPSPADVEEAREKFEEFHRHPPTKIFSSKTPMPTRVKKLGDAAFVLYESKKNDPDTGLPVKDAIRYIHDHDSAGVETYEPVASGGVAVPAWIRDTTSVVILGKCLGYAWKDEGTGEELERSGRPYPDLCCTPCGRALLVIRDRTEVIAIIWGGALGVEARGIVG